jgi:type II secretory pathway pseudopilin PulG
MNIAHFNPIERNLREKGSVLLEVLLALMLFAGAAAVVTTAFNSSVASLERQKLGFQALNLAASVLAEVQLGIRSATSDAPTPFEPPFEDWTWQTSLIPTETSGGDPAGLPRLEVVVRHKNSPMVQRLGQVVRLRSEALTNAVSTPPLLEK